jgi:uncharacterized CHY-type Zn-finger protein
MKSSHKMNVTFDANDVGTAIEAAWNEALLCGTCMQKIATQEMSQSDFCPTCQAAVTARLMATVERRMRAELLRQGLAPDSVQIESD